jgi:hypothetical protein
MPSIHVVANSVPFIPKKKEKRKFHTILTPAEVIIKKG